MTRVWQQYLSQYKGLLGIALLCAGVVTAAAVFFTEGLKPAINLLFHLPEDTFTHSLPEWVRMHPMIAVPAAFVAAAMIRFVAQRILTLSLNQVGNSLVGRMQQQLFSRFVHADLGRLQQAHSGQYLSSVLYDADLVREAASSGLVFYIQALLMVVSQLIVMVRQDWMMTAAVIITGPILGAVMNSYLKATRRAAEGAMAETSTLSTAVMESLDGIKIVKISNQEASEEDRVGTVIGRRQGHLLKGANARSMAAPATEVLTGILIAALLTFAGWRAQSGLTAGGLFAFLTALLVASQALRQMAGLHGTFNQGITAARRLFAALDIEPEIVSHAEAKPLPRDFKAIVFDHAAFGYDPAQPVLKDIDFTVHAGETVALVGPSGSGKSTLLNLIPRFFDLTSGDIRFDGLSHRDIALQVLRSRIALVTQDPFLFDDTIRANIAYGRPDATDADIERAARDAAAHDFIMELPQGYATRAGEAGSRLSGGQKQRIAIARAFLKDAPLLLLDEATSALDTQSEIKVQQALERLMTGRTTFVVAHRLSTVRHADHILVLDRGEIVERGTHDSLMRAGGLYARLAATQFAAQPEEAS